MVTFTDQRAHERTVDGTPISLAINSILSINQNTCRTRVACLTGSIWITQEFDNVDHVLASGDQFMSCQKGMIVLWALSDCHITVQSKQ
jgi:hypothetical protein